MKKFFINIFLFIAVYAAYKLVLLSSVLLLHKQPLHQDLGQNGSNQYIVAGSSNVYYSYNYDILNSDSSRHVRSCWVPASYGVALNLFKLDQIAKENSNIIFEYPYHWYLADQMAPHVKSFYAHATPRLFKFLLQRFPVDFLIHFAQYTVLNQELYQYYHEQMSFKRYKEDFNKFNARGDFDAHYYHCDTSVYSRSSQFVLCSQFQEFQFNKIIGFLDDLARKRNIKYAYSFPPLDSGNYIITPLIVKRLATKAITPFDSSIWPRKYLYDTRYHLNYCGTQINSNKLLGQLSTTKAFNE